MSGEGKVNGKNKMRRSEQGKLWNGVVIHKYLINIIITILLSAVLSFIGILLSDVVDLVNVRRYLESPLLFALNTLPLTLFMLLIYHLTCRQWAAFTFGGGLFLTMQIVNRFKMKLREEPFIFSDILLGPEAARVVKLSEMPISLSVVLSCAFWLVCSVLLFIFVKSDKHGRIVKIAGITLSVALFTTALFGIYKDYKLYDSFKVRGSIYSRVDQFKSRGFLYSFLVKANSIKSIKPEGYSKAEAEQLLQQYEKKSGEGKQKDMPHIIAIMGEAFYDIDRVPGIEFTEGHDPLANFNRIIRQAYSGRIVTNIFGGGTANTEFAFLTGHSMPIMPEMSSPYSSYLRKDTFSLARILEKRGYASLAFHPGESWFYNRSNVYNFFGFDRIFFKKDMDLENVKFNHGYISDTDTYEFLLERFNEHLAAKPEAPLFEFVVTIDNHGPYSKEDIGYPEMLHRKKEMDISAYRLLNNYINGVSRCDQALGQLVDSISEIEEPVVLLYFADHLPFLGENDLGYKALNFDVNQSGEAEAFLNHYGTPFFIWSNRAAQKLLAGNGVPLLTGNAPMISANYIATELLKYTGIDGGAYFNFLSKLKEDLPIITNRFIKENNMFTENISEKSEIMMDKYRKMQYYMIMEKKAAE